MLFLERLRETARQQPDKTAIEFRGGVSARVVSYHELLSRTDRTAAWLVQRGVQPGDRVAVCLPKSMAGIELHLAACSLGAVSMPLNPTYSAQEIEFVLRDSGARLLVASEASGFDGLSDGLATTIAAIDPQLFDREVPASVLDASQTPADPGQTALILYTSGTTGRPKGACHSHASLTANMDMLSVAWQWSSDDVLLHALPLFHVHGLLVGLHGALHAGATTVMLPAFEAETVLGELRTGAYSVFMGVPTMYHRLLACASGDCSALGRIRLLASGSDRLPEETFRRIEERFGGRVVERYGMTETGIMTSNPLDGDRVPGQVGLPLPAVEMRVCDPETGSPCPEGEVGELQTRGPHLFTGYWQDPAKTRDAFTADGWFRTGDLGICDERGRYELKGRAKDLIITGGLNVYPSEVEQILLLHPAVEQCAVAGIPDEEWGECVTAFVVCPAPAPVEQDLIDHCRQSLAGYKTPKRFAFVDSLPRNAMGKVRKGELVSVFTSA